MTWTRLALVASLTLWVGCTRDSVVNGDPPQTVIDADALAFVQVPLGETDTQTLTIRNVGRGDLILESVEIVEETDDDEGGLEFAKGDGWVDSAVVTTEGELELQVHYTPTDRTRDLGYIELQTNDPNHTDGILQVPLETPVLEPRLYSKASVLFRRVPPVDDETRDTYWQITQVQNVGHAPLQVTDIVVSPDNGPFDVGFPDYANAHPRDDAPELSTTLAPGESIPVRVYFNPIDDEPSDGELVIYSNDPESPEYVVGLIGNSGAPCLEVSPNEEFDFGNGAVGFVNHKTAVLENCSSTADLVVSDVAVCTFVDGVCDSDAKTFSVKEDSWPGGLPEDKLVIGPQESSLVVLSYAPEELVESTGEMTVSSDDPARPELTIPLIGRGTDNACPTAVAEARLVESARWQPEINTIPLQTVRFRGSSSEDPDGSIAEYEWHLVEKPPNSQARLNPGSRSAEPSMFLDLAGDYIVELLVWDDEETRNCGEPAMVHIRATPDEDIHVQLVWETPHDVDETDTSGSDVDLHFLHPSGEWNRSPHDIFWSNPSSDWGAPGHYDDPTLDIDDTDGGGPENVNLSEPESGASYTVGVYYYADSGYGSAYATVRIFIRGEQRFERRSVFLERPEMFWNVATISWPSTEIRAIEDVGFGFPQ